MYYLSTVKTGNVRKFRIASDVLDGWTELTRDESVESLRTSCKFWKNYYYNFKLSKSVRKHHAKSAKFSTADIELYGAGTNPLCNSF